MAIGPTIDPEEVGTTGLLWLFLSYGYALFYAADLIGEGSELLLLVPSMAGLVGGVVLPLLGAVPDGGTYYLYCFNCIECQTRQRSVPSLVFFFKSKLAHTFILFSSYSYYSFFRSWIERGGPRESQRRNRSLGGIHHYAFDDSLGIFCLCRSC